MQASRAVLTGVVTAIVTLASAHAACVSSVPLLRAHSLSPNITPGPAVWTGTSLLVFGHEEDPADAVWAAAYTEEGYEIAPPRQIAPASVFGPLAAAWSGTEAGVVYRTRSAMFLQRLDAGGTPLGGPMAIPAKRSLYDADLVDMVWAGALGGWLVVRRVGGGSPDLYATVLSPAGVVLRDELLDIGPRRTHRVAVTAEAIAGVFAYGGDGNLYLSRLGAGQTTRLLAAGSAGEDFVVAASGSEFALVQARISSGTTALYLRRLDDGGNLIAAEKKLIEHGGDIVPLSLVAREDEISLAYLDSPEGFDADPGVYRLRRMRLDGTVLADTHFAAAGMTRRASWSEWAHVWTGQAWVSIVPRYVGDAPATYLVRLCPLAVSVSAPAVVRVGTPVQFRAPADGGVPEYDYFWSFGDKEFSGQAAPVHVYEREGTFTVDVEVTDDTGTSVTATVVVRAVDGKRRGVRH